MVFMLYLIALAGLGVSSLLFIDYRQPASLFCGDGGGCELARHSDFSSIFGISTPILGLLFYTVALGLIVWPARRLLIAWAAGGALAALGFIAVQLFVLHGLCKFCMITDVGALALFGLAVATRRRPQPRAALQLASLGGAVVVSLAPYVYARSQPPKAPPPQELITEGLNPPMIQREQRPGMATIVEFVDFECPYCRRLHENMTSVLKDYSGKVRLVRKQRPLAKIHPHAEVAARASCCADEAGRGDAMAEALYAAPPDELTADGCESLAAKIGLDLAAYRQCFASERPTAQLAADAADAAEGGIGNEAPVFWIGTTRYRGAHPPDVIRAGIERALRP